MMGISDRKGILMGNHGLLVVGRSIPEAFHHALHFRLVGQHALIGMEAKLVLEPQSRLSDGQ